jgi:hypothetical protein
MVDRERTLERKREREIARERKRERNNGRERERREAFEPLFFPIPFSFSIHTYAHRENVIVNERL